MEEGYTSYSKGLDRSLERISSRTNNEDSEKQPLLFSKKDPGSKLKWSTRYFVAVMACLGFASSYGSRVNMSVAIIAMANRSYSTDYSQNQSSTELCPQHGDLYSNETGGRSKEGEFPWDAHTQELILSAYYYGFVLLQVPAGILSDRYPKSCSWIYGLGVFLSSVGSLLIPLAAHHSVTAIFITRFICGLAESGTYPSMYSFMSRWAPSADRSILLAIVYAGLPIGHIVMQPISGLLAESSYGWSSSFYMIGITWFVFWTIFIYDSPNSHPSINSEEKEYLIKELQLWKKPPTSYPWFRIITSLPVMAVGMADFAILWILHSLTTNLPIFLSEALRFDVITAGALSAFPYAILLMTLLGGGFLADYLISRTKLSRTVIRKLMTSLGLIFSALFMVSSGYTGCNAAATITMLSLGLASTGLVYSGASLTQMEFATPYAGIVTAIANTFANTPGFLSPMIAGVVTENQADMLGWRKMYWIAFGIAIFAEVIVLLFCTSELQSWAVIEKDDQKTEKYKEVK
ncbi:sialin-like [Strongylocentrotus purpuratus]|uniref:Major facilitator superfamily (MFS) profile domain-containing protein n=1 Tax=Strongylocentrotus purpuratus TaxID=7668 RepID=A0A7M7PSU8_STRPU|nr:sialin-like [Strongylocentrotus purpuratus]